MEYLNVGLYQTTTVTAEATLVLVRTHCEIGLSDIARHCPKPVFVLLYYTLFIACSLLCKYDQLK